MMAGQGQQAYRRLKHFLAALLMLPVMAFAASACSRTPSGVSGDGFIEAAARKYNVAPADLEVTNTSVMRLPLTGREARVAKLRNRWTNEKYQIALNERGRVVDPEQWLLDERRALERKYGRLDPKLSETLASAGPGDLFAVVVSFGGRKEDALRAKEDLEREWAARGFNIKFSDINISSVIVELPKEEILALSRRREIQLIAEEQTEAQAE